MFISKLLITANHENKYIQHSNNQSNKFMNSPIVDNTHFNFNCADNYSGLLTKRGKGEVLDLFMKRNKQMTNKENTILLK